FGGAGHRRGHGHHDARHGREMDDEGGPLAGFALHHDAAAVQGHQLLHDAEADAGALETARRRRLDLHESVEDPVEVMRRDPDALVGDGDPDPFPVAAHRDHHGAYRPGGYAGNRALINLN